jgi:hypothetical protein
MATSGSCSHVVILAKLASETHASHINERLDHPPMATCIHAYNATTCMNADLRHSKQHVAPSGTLLPLRLFTAAKHVQSTSTNGGNGTSQKDNTTFVKDTT